ncbi:MAG: DUF1573 domain-containing protein [Bacteroidetes bacterium]|nr:MAG: DUF1573 domain-containing protein [Bacteroidota bacterium]
MKSVIFSAVMLIGSMLMTKSVNAQPTVEAGPKIEFSKEVHDYGEIKYGANGTCVFSFKNTGNAPLIISKAQGSCGCTVPSWPKEPIAPGATSEITVKYDTKRPGPIAKSVTITSNAVNHPTKVIRIKGKVGPAPSNPTPVNNSGPGNH